ncbi:MAG: four-carbon acid sugar kinase family protein [Comamonadaceae bacterium]|nr:MAG: four-carbon acid sugar kinase family protein [Comamonadaceae bacterium]
MQKTPNHLLLGCIADDFTGATDLANNLVRAGMRVLQVMGVPDAPLAADVSVDAVVIALKSRTIPAEEAVAQSLQALSWLQAHSAQQIYFKYCSTFDSTPGGNIGPVTEALMSALGEDFTIATPAFPDNGRSVFKGYLFVGDVLLHESGMRNHPLTPMTDSSLVRVMQAQCTKAVGLVDHVAVAAGTSAIADRIAALKHEGIAIAIVDATSNADLMEIGKALAGMRLVTAGSGVAIGLPQNFGIEPSGQAAQLPPAAGHRAVISGSCSVATNRQVARFKDNGGDSFAVDPMRMAQGVDVAAEALAWAAPLLGQKPLLVYATAAAEAVSEVQQKIGREEAGAMVEQTLARVAQGLVGLGVGQLVVAGGETSGACVQALGITQMLIGAQIDPGVPWCHASDAGVGTGTGGLHIALKSGNFGSEDFFTKALDLLD